MKLRGYKTELSVYDDYLLTKIRMAGKILL